MDGKYLFRISFFLDIGYSLFLDPFKMAKTRSSKDSSDRKDNKKDKVAPITVRLADHSIVRPSSTAKKKSKVNFVSFIVDIYFLTYSFFL